MKYKKTRSPLFFQFFKANVVCRQLGFSNGATSAPCCSPYGLVPTTFSYDDVQCAGTEATLDSCSHLNTHNCVSTEGAGVVCNTGTTVISKSLFGFKPFLLNPKKFECLIKPGNFNL